MSWRFTIKDLLLSMTLIGLAFGCGAQAMAASLKQTMSFSAFLAIISICPLLVAGVLAPFHRARLGAYVGFLVQVISALIALLFLIGWQETFRYWPNRFVAALTAFVIGLAAFSVWRKATTPTSSERLD